MPRRKTAAPRGILKTTAADPRRIVHARHHPSADLEPYVEHFWSVRWDLRGRPAHRAETLPHPSVHLLFEPGKGASIGGVARGKFSILLEGTGSAFSTKFRPGGFYPFVRTPIATFTDSVVPLDTVWGAAGGQLERDVLAVDDDDRKIALVERFLRAREPQPDSGAALATTIVDAIAADRGMVTMDEIARRFGVHPRTLQRLFARYVGVNPKWVVQRYRLHEAAEQLASNPASQAALAMELGYADQPHFVKDFKSVVGTSPAAYARRTRSIT